MGGNQAPPPRKLPKRAGGWLLWGVPTQGHLFSGLWGLTTHPGCGVVRQARAPLPLAGSLACPGGGGGAMRSQKHSVRLLSAMMRWNTRAMMLAASPNVAHTPHGPMRLPPPLPVTRRALSDSGPAPGHPANAQRPSTTASIHPAGAPRPPAPPLCSPGRHPQTPRPGLWTRGRRPPPGPPATVPRGGESCGPASNRHSKTPHGAPPGRRALTGLVPSEPPALVPPRVRGSPGVEAGGR